MPFTEKGNQCEKLFEHLNYCISVLKKSQDQAQLEIIKRVQHDIQLLQKYIKTILKYSDKRENEFENIMVDLKIKNNILQTQNNIIQTKNSQIQQLACQISKKDSQIDRKSDIIEHLKYSKKIDASYVSSIIFNDNTSNGQKNNSRCGKYGKFEQEIQKQDLLDLSRYSEHCEDQKLGTKDTATTSKSEVTSEIKRNSKLINATIYREKKAHDQHIYSGPKNSNIDHKASSLIFTE